jgi:hypothetical protein
MKYSYDIVTQRTIVNPSVYFFTGLGELSHSTAHFCTLSHNITQTFLTTVFNLLLLDSNCPALQL